METHNETSDALQGEAPLPLAGAQRHLAFAAWPQALAHASWLDALASRCGLDALPRAFGPNCGLQDLALARALLSEVGARRDDAVAHDGLPHWVLLPLAAMRRHLSTVAARLIAPTLQRAVGQAQAQLWDAVLGDGVRRAALVLAQQTPVDRPLAAALEPLSRQALESCRAAETWEPFCLALGLRALLGSGPAGPSIAARVRLVWPLRLANVAPLDVEALEPMARTALLTWLQDCCARGTTLRPHKAPAELPSHSQESACI